MDHTTGRVIAVAIEVAGCCVRKLPGHEDFDELIRETMSVREVPEDNFEAIYAIANAMMAFSNAVRVAERKDFPILHYLGETIPPKR